MKLSVLSAAFALAGSAIAAPTPIIPGLPKLPGLGSLPSVQGIPDALVGQLVPSVTKTVSAAGLGSFLGPLQGLLGGELGGLPLPLKARQDVEAEISGMTPEQAAQMIQSMNEIASALQVDKAIDGKLPEVPSFSKEKQEQLLGAFKALVTQLAPLAKNGLKDIALKLDAIKVPVQGLTARDPIIGGLPIVGGLLNGGAGGILSVVAGPLSILTQVLGMAGVAPLLGPVLSTISGLGL
ncbi:hypothetical protein, variant 2 [Blastomyces gilchristii SLH14081]|uniref:Antigenic cell wall galactomannoprotein n=1 Tax=Blastomyces gilchristii (strain SLH14081) TaxID=559298 RepID=A0A179UZ49_BLAGS|nr:hypothetical protein, variant 2 [Blastomyces gilchristii SLH14081]XP_031580717.1 uncharacterized protein BDBG_08379 [Blastomyces gilchristii SLH14081]XP_031580718.1 hypothetical protein, variant 1 [Blastomyces gilchristii SLH14081]OAT13112.1 hypothetical protein BDBG_08379 [Blastomyces gilchristii SLH14081]OAT13113.1 hypothetical protein, variant 1 [Blastomyces gilchristii SLH14081]OAT13114.1 hypothetical protein, variant 2 [Blastomyces gilchristii SLH14081]